jgi:TPR repeat protein
VGQPADLNLANQFLQRALDGGYAPAATTLGDVNALKGDRKQAEKYWIQAAESGDTGAMRSLLDPSHHTETLRNSKDVNRYLTRGCIWKDEQLTRRFAARLLLGESEPSPEDFLAQYLLQMAADKGDVRAMALQGRARLQGLWQTTPNAARGRRELQWLADGADPTGSAAFLLGQALWEGAGLPRDVKEAIKLIHKAADAGFEPARDWLTDYKLTAELPSSRPTTYPDALAQYMSVMQSLSATLSEAAVKIDAPASDSASLPAMAESDQVLEDNDVFHETVYYQSYPIPQATVERIIRRAVNGVADARTKTWAAIAVERGDYAPTGCKVASGCGARGRSYCHVFLRLVAVIG